MTTNRISSTSSRQYWITMKQITRIMEPRVRKMNPTIQVEFSVYFRGIGYSIGDFAAPDADQVEDQENCLQHSLLDHHGVGVGQIEGLEEEKEEDGDRKQGLVVGLEGEQQLQGKRAQRQGVPHLYICSNLNYSSLWALTQPPFEYKSKGGQPLQLITFAMSTFKTDMLPFVPTVIHKKVKSTHAHIAHSIDSYTTGILLGKGGFAICHQATRQRNSQEVAVKIISKSSASMRKPGAIIRLQNQINIMRHMKDPHILKLLDSFEDDRNYYLILQLCDKLSLNDLIKQRKSLTEPEARYFIRQLVQVLIYTKANKVIHRDVKACNILLDSSLEIKLADFGLATYHDSDNGQRYNVCGTPNYMAPEIIKKQRYSYEVDIWATGIVTYFILFNKCPFASHDQKQTYKKIEALDYTFPSKKISSVARDFIQKILCLDPESRMKPEDAIQHSFLTEQIPQCLPESCIRSSPKKLKMLPETVKEEQIKSVIKIEELKAVKSRKKIQSSIQITAKKQPRKGSTGTKRNKEVIITSKKKQEDNSIRKITNYMSPIPAKDLCLFQEERRQHSSEEDNKEHVDRMRDEKEQQQIAPAPQITPKMQPNIQQKVAEEEKPLCEWLRINLKGHPFVVDFLDESNKFGICYMLSSKVRGIFFHDESMMTLDEIKRQVMYIRKNYQYDKVSDKLKFEAHSSNATIKPVFKNAIYFQYLINPSQMSLMEKQVIRKYETLEEYAMRYQFRMPGEHGELVRMEIAEPGQQNLIKNEHENQDKKFSALQNGGNNNKEYLKLKQISTLKHWVVVRKAGKKVYMMVLNDLVQIFFEDGAKFYIQKKPLNILFVIGNERKIFIEPLQRSELEQPMKFRFQMVDYLLNYLLKKQQKARNL